MCKHIERRFQGRTESVPAARRLVAQTLEEWGVDEADVAAGAGGDLVLVASELVTNAAKAASSTFVVTVDAHRDYVDLTVMDEDPRPARRLEPGLDLANGRGLGIVDALSSQWGQTPFDGLTKTVWCRVDLPAGSILGRECRL